MSCHDLLPLSERNHEPFFVFLDVSICCMLNLVYPHGRHYGLPFRSQNRILDTIPLDQMVLFDHSLLPFLLGYFFIAGRICINYVSQQCHITGVFFRPLTFFGSLVILFFILDDLLCPRWCSFLKVDLPFSLYLLKLFSSAMVSLARATSYSSSELSSLVPQNDLQVKFNCMIRSIS